MTRVRRWQVIYRCPKAATYDRVMVTTTTGLDEAMRDIAYQITSRHGHDTRNCEILSLSLITGREQEAELSEGWGEYRFRA